jgi:phosphatase and actin regulator 4
MQTRHQTQTLPDADQTQTQTRHQTQTLPDADQKQTQTRHQTQTRRRPDADQTQTRRRPDADQTQTRRRPDADSPPRHRPEIRCRPSQTQTRHRRRPDTRRRPDNRHRPDADQTQTRHRPLPAVERSYFEHSQRTTPTSITIIIMNTPVCRLLLALLAVCSIPPAVFGQPTECLTEADCEERMSEGYDKFEVGNFPLSG